MNGHAAAYREVVSANVLVTGPGLHQELRQQAQTLQGLFHKIAISHSIYTLHLWTCAKIQQSPEVTNWFPHTVNGWCIEGIAS